MTSFQLSSDQPPSDAERGERQRVRRRSRSKTAGGNGSKKFTVNLKCRHCGVRYRSNPFVGRCPKCSCALRHNISIWDAILSLVVPLFGLIRCVMLWSRTPIGSFEVFLLGLANSAALMYAYEWVSLNFK